MCKHKRFIEWFEKRGWHYGFIRWIACNHVRLSERYGWVVRSIVAATTERYNVLQEEIAKEGFWDDLEHSQKVLQESKTLENRINSYKKMQSELEDIITLIELSLEEGETESTPDMNAECDAFIKKLEEMKAKQD